MVGREVESGRWKVEGGGVTGGRWWIVSWGFFFRLEGV